MIIPESSDRIMTRVVREKQFIKKLFSERSSLCQTAKNYNVEQFLLTTKLRTNRLLNTGRAGTKLRAQKYLNYNNFKK